MLFSIVIPVYNRAERVKPTLDSVLAQSHRPLQVVLVDNCSTDDSLSVLKAFQEQHSQADFEVVVAQETHHTASATRNRGFREAKGDWVLFFDSDDTMRPALVEEYRKAIEHHREGLDIVAVKARLHSRDGKSRDLPFFTSDAMANHILHSILATQRYAVRREYFEKAGIWNNDILQWDDWELGVRLMLGQPKMAFVGEALVDIYDSGEASITGTNFHDRKGRWEAVLDEGERQVARSRHPEKTRMLRLIDFRRVILAAHYAMEGYEADARALYETAFQRLTQGSTMKRWVLSLLYKNTRSGRRGSSRIARHLFTNKSEPKAMADPKLFTIVIPVYNRSEKVKTTLNSVLAQTHRPLQLVLVDNCSTDNTLSVLQDFQAKHSQPDFEVVVEQESRHTASAARNKGFQKAKGDWVMFFDSDDTMHPTLVEEYQNAIARQGENVDLVVVKAKRHKLGGGCRVLPFFTSDSMANHILHSILATQRYAVSRDYFADFGGWNPDFYEWNDWELGVRLMLGLPRMAFVKKALVDIYDSGEESITGTNFHDRKGRWERVLDEAERQVAQSQHPDKERMLRLIDFRRLVLAAQYAHEGHAADAQALYNPTRERLVSGSCLRRHIIPMLYKNLCKGHRGSSRLSRYILK